MEIILHLAVARILDAYSIIVYFFQSGNRFFKIVSIGGINSEKV